MGEKCNHICTLCVGLALGVTSALWMFLLGLASIAGHGGTLVTTLSSIYPGFGSSIEGSLIGALWGFIVGFVYGVVFAFLYNLFSKRH